MPNALSTSPASIFSSARAARASYDDAVTTDGVSARAWWRIAGDLHRSCDGLNSLLATGAVPADYVLTPGMVQCLHDRAIDAEHRAQLIERMVESARRQPVIDMSTLQWIPVVGAEVV